MMMAHDSSPPRRELSAQAVSGLEAALTKYLVDDSAASGLQEALRVIAAEAREKNVHAEQLLLLLKDIWFGLPQIRQAPAGKQQSDLLQRAVSLCIREYYST
jgi:hypothetical protein